jgi:hypothetical protein
LVHEVVIMFKLIAALALILGTDFCPGSGRHVRPSLRA